MGADVLPLASAGAGPLLAAGADDEPPAPSVDGDSVRGLAVTGGGRLPVLLPLDVAPAFHGAADPAEGMLPAVDGDVLPVEGCSTRPPWSGTR